MPPYTPRLPVKLQIGGKVVKVVVDFEESALIGGKRLVYKLGIWKRAKKVTIRQKHGSFQRYFIVN